MRTLSLQLMLIGLIMFVVFWSPTNIGVHSHRFLLENKPGCNQKGIHQLEVNIAKLVGIGDQYGRSFPENHNDLKGYCRETVQLNRKVESFFKKCYRKEMSDIAGIIIYSVKNTIKRFCSKRRSKKLTSLLRVSPCLNQKLRRNDTCLLQFVNQTKQLIDLKDSTKKIPYTCCTFFNTLDCIDKLIDSAPCARNYRTLIFEFLSSMYSNIADVMCSEYDPSTDRCSKLPPLTNDKFNSIKNNNTYISFPVVMIDLFESV